jgi:hypothetical protein
MTPETVDGISTTTIGAVPVIGAVGSAKGEYFASVATKLWGFWMTAQKRLEV